MVVVQVVPPSLEIRVPPSESGGAGNARIASLATGGAVPEPPEAVPPLPATPTPLEQVPLTDGLQTNSLPQSWSVLHGNCHLKAQVETVVSVQLSGGVGTVVTSQAVLAGQVAPPPLHETAFSA